MDQVLTGLRAAAESSRLRLLRLCAEGELTVSDLVGVLGQSQPRVSRHLRLLCEAGLLDRFRDGAFVFYRLARRGAGAKLARAVLAMVPDAPLLALDRQRLDALRRARADTASAYFRRNAAQWDKIRSLYVDEREVEAALLALLPEQGMGDLLDVGTGTGRMLELFAPRVEHALGVDLSREMLAVARVNLEHAGLRNCSLRQGDMYQLPLADESFDAAIFHQVLHYAADPVRAIREAARVLQPGGRLVVVDFAPHEVEELRSDAAHLRLGFADDEVVQWCVDAGFDPGVIMHLPGNPLTVTLWSARRRLALPSARRVTSAGDAASAEVAS
ncbi:MAG TPA: metalloregulator ArsR/SmtB family transcription factor [Stellaceae bacterium]|nr:metalloregulator ArsR/SmtB family transcription factor [Stellaceae bacterium]